MTNVHNTTTTYATAEGGTNRLLGVKFNRMLRTMIKFKSIGTICPSKFLSSQNVFGYGENKGKTKMMNKTQRKKIYKKSNSSTE